MHVLNRLRNRYAHAIMIVFLPGVQTNLLLNLMITHIRSNE